MKNLKMNKRTFKYATEKFVIEAYDNEDITTASATADNTATGSINQLPSTSQPDQNAINISKAHYDSGIQLGVAATAAIAAFASGSLTKQQAAGTILIAAVGTCTTSNCHLSPYRP
ncbi:MAG: hypothetical protein KDI01_08955 [Halioglobus sp.]|nr:hypothetical protein [Halioglobus sp.]